MNEYIIYYELGDHKMRTTVAADSQQQALEIIRNKIIIHKITPILTNPFRDIFQSFKTNK